MKRLCCLLLLLSLCVPAWAAEKTVPTSITADKLTYSLDQDTVIFSGQVHVVRPDLEIFADTITAHLTKGKGDKGGKAEKADKPADKANPLGGVSGDKAIERIVAKGNVRMTHQGKEGRCAQATFDAIQGVFTMEGNPVIVDGANRIQGETIKFYLKDSRSEVVGGPKRRVEAIFTTPEGKNPAFDFKPKQ